MVRSRALGVLLLASLLAGCEPGQLSGPAGVVVNGPPGPPPPPPSPAASLPEMQAANVQPPESAIGADSAAPAEALASQSAEEFTTTTQSLPVTPGQGSPAAPTGEPVAAPFVNLSAGIALPQLLPEGTQVGVSVDYSLRGNPQTSCRYFLVVASSAGETPVPVALEPRGGTIQVFLPAEVRPEHQPFRAQIDEVSPQGQRTRVSNSATLATSY